MAVGMQRPADLEKECVDTGVAAGEDGDDSASIASSLEVSRR